MHYACIKQQLARSFSRLPVVGTDRSSRKSVIQLMKIKPDTFEVVYDVWVEQAETETEDYVTCQEQNLLFLAKVIALACTRERLKQKSTETANFKATKTVDNECSLAAASFRQPKNSYSVKSGWYNRPGVAPRHSLKNRYVPSVYISGKLHLCQNLLLVWHLVEQKIQDSL